jgi:hypothetical protein
MKRHPCNQNQKMDDQQFTALTNYLSDIHTELNRIANALEDILEKGIKRDPLP